MVGGKKTGDNLKKRSYRKMVMSEVGLGRNENSRQKPLSQEAVRKLRSRV